MPIKVIEPQRLYRQISDQLRTLIVAGEFPVGSRLPSERDLAVQLGVSRPSLREALIALEVQGYIEVRMGSGIYICEPPAPSGNRPDLSGEEGPLEVIQARILLEGEVAAIAAKAGNKPQFDAIEEAINMMEADALAGIKPVEADRLFHVRIAEATGNSVLVDVVKRMFDFRMGPLFDQLDSHFETNDVWQDAIREHREILKALRSKKPELAKSAMQNHMGIAFKRLTSSLVTGRKPAARRRRATVAESTAVSPRAVALSRKGGK